MTHSSQPLHIQEHLAVQAMQRGSGFQAYGIRGDYALMDPYLMADHYRMSQPTFGPHPHAGFSAVTYMFDDAETGFNNRDSRGDASAINPGDAHWTVAGAGVVHDEVPMVNGQVAHGLQIFVNLAAADKHMPPSAIHLPSDAMARSEQAGGAHVKTAFGNLSAAQEGAVASTRLPTDVTLLDVSAKASKRFTYEVPKGYNAFAIVVSGSIAVASEPVAAHQAVAFGRAGGVLEITAVTDAHFAVFIGKPLDEAVVRHGPFAMTNQADIDRAISDYQAGRMGAL
jgi:redox-sensitive bicupin YhaK (pirin superfamily)